MIKHVHIGIESSALGDSLAWVPYAEMFRERHDCQVTCVTAWGDLFDYPLITFAKPEDPVQGATTLYRIGCHDVNDRSRSPVPWNTVPLQVVAAGILGLPAIEVRPKIKITNSARPNIDGRYVCIASGATAKCKEWNYPGCWAVLTRTLKQHGFKVVNLSPATEPIPGTIQETTGSVYAAIPCLLHCEFFIGLPSGLSWMAWGLEKHVVMISGFSEPWTEFQSGRTHIGPPHGVCRGCYNTNAFDKEADNWCPRNPPFECTRSITPETVIEAISNSGLLQSTP